MKVNIFASSSCPLESAECLDDKRVIKMILESTQLLSTALNELGANGPYKTTHVNHPCSIWTRTSKSNWLWVLNHACSLCLVYTRAYDKRHKCEDYLREMTRFTDLSIFPNIGNTPFPNCTTFKDVVDTHKAYRLYLSEKWKTDKRKPTWIKRNQPTWA